jgi:hypothetical protein
LYQAGEPVPDVAAAVGVPVHRVYLVREAHRMLRARNLSDGSAVLQPLHEARRLAEKRREQRQEGR